MRIIATSNYADEMFSESVVLDVSNLNPRMAYEIVKTMNDSKWRADSIYYVIKPDDYKLYSFQP